MSASAASASHLERANAAEVEISRLKEAIRHVIADSPGTPETVKGYLRDVLKGAKP